MKKKVLFLIAIVAISSLVGCSGKNKNEAIYIDDLPEVTQGASTEDNSGDVVINSGNAGDIDVFVPEPIPDVTEDLGNNELGNVTVPGEFEEAEKTQEEIELENSLALKYEEKNTRTIVKFYDSMFSLDDTKKVEDFIYNSIDQMAFEENVPVIMNYKFEDLGYPDKKGNLITGCVRISQSDSYVLHIYLFDIDGKTYAFSLENKLSIYDVAANLNHIITSFSLDNEELLPDYSPDVEDEQTPTEGNEDVNVPDSNEENNAENKENDINTPEDNTQGEENVTDEDNIIFPMQKEEPYTFSLLVKEMYARGNVHIRTLPCIEGDVVSVLKKGESIQVVGQCNETNWYQVIFEGDEAYISNKWLVD